VVCGFSSDYLEMHKQSVYVSGKRWSRWWEDEWKDQPVTLADAAEAVRTLHTGTPEQIKNTRINTYLFYLVKGTSFINGGESQILRRL